MGGTAQAWTTVIPSDLNLADLKPGSSLELRVVMTKFGSPAVNIAYEVRLERQ